MENREAERDTVLSMSPNRLTHAKLCNSSPRREPTRFSEAKHERAARVLHVSVLDGNKRGVIGQLKIVGVSGRVVGRWFVGIVARHRLFGIFSTLGGR